MSDFRSWKRGLIALALLGMSSAAAAQCVDYQSHLRPAGHVTEAELFSHVWACAAVGDLVYATGVTSVAGLGVIDVSDPDAPVVGQIIDLASYATDMAARASYLYLASVTAGLTTVSIANPVQPVVLGTIDTPGSLGQLATANGYLFACDGVGGLRVYSLANPAAPFLVSSLALGDALSIALSGTYAYVGTAASGVSVVDVSNPASPSIVATLPTSNPCRETVIDGSTLWVGEGSPDFALHLRRANVLNPAAPAWDSAFYYIYGHDFAVNDGVLSLTNASGPFQAYSTSGLAPNLIGSVPYGAEHDVAVSNGRAYLCGRGLQILDVTGVTNPAAISSVMIGTEATGLLTVGSRVYVAAGSDGLKIVDASNPDAPAVLSTVTEISPSTIDVSGTLAATCGAEVALLDVSDPDQPVVLHTFVPAGGASDVDLDGSRLCLSGNPNYPDLRIYDVSNPTAPQLLSQYDDEDYGASCFYGKTVDASGDLLALGVEQSLACWTEPDQGLVRIFDISNAAQPLLLSTTWLAGRPNELVISGSILEVASSASPNLMDISDPAHPFEVARAPYWLDANRIEHSSGTHLFAARSSLSLFSGFANGELIWEGIVPLHAVDVTEVGDRIWVLTDGNDEDARIRVYGAPCVTAAAPAPLPERSRTRLNAWPAVSAESVTLRLDQPTARMLRGAIFDVMGRTLHEFEIAAGDWEVTWDGRDEARRPVPSGVYWARVNDGGQSAAARIVLRR